MHTSLSTLQLTSLPVQRLQPRFLVALQTSAEPNDIEGLCKAYPTIKRICLASGKSTAKEFLRHNAEWLKRSNNASSHKADCSVTPGLVLQDNAMTLDVFGKKNLRHLLPETAAAGDGRIRLSVMFSVSPVRATCIHGPTLVYVYRTYG